MNRTFVDSLFDNLMRLYLILLQETHRLNVINQSSTQIVMQSNESVSNHHENAFQSLTSNQEDQSCNTSNLQDASSHEDVPNVSTLDVLMSNIQEMSSNHEEEEVSNSSSTIDEAKKHACNFVPESGRNTEKKEGLNFVLVSATSIVEKNYSKVKRKRGRPRKVILN